MSNPDLLYFYSRYKQATEGPCNVPKPSFYQLTEKSKWQAWTDLGELDKETAKSDYIERLDSLEPEWRGKEAKDPTSGWVAVSCPVSEKKIPEEDKTVWDRVKEGDTEMLKEILSAENCELKDEGGLTLLHWAADRGHIDVAKHILNASPSCIDRQDDEGQTALHYAASCGHSAMVRLLLSNGANPNHEDSDGIPPTGVDTDPETKQVFAEFK